MAHIAGSLVTQVSLQLPFSPWKVLQDLPGRGELVRVQQVPGPMEVSRTRGTAEHTRYGSANFEGTFLFGGFTGKLKENHQFGGSPR